MRHADEESFRELARQWIPSLRHTAYLLCGDWHLADDLVQTTGLKLFRAWPKVDRSQVPHNYARKVLVNSWLDERRRSWRRNEQNSDSLPDTEVDGPSPADLYERQVTRGRLLRALATLPRGQRAVLVLRYFESMSITETAGALGCSEGNVKSQTSRGLTALKAAYDQTAELAAADTVRESR